MAVSGGADSLATALLIRDWVRPQSGAMLALVVDHGLRAESASEAALTLQRLAVLGIDSHLITLRDLKYGPSLAERARLARHTALEAACAARGILHLVFGHHAEDQAETICMRLLAQSGPHGLAGMAGVVETPHLRRLRPLLNTAPQRLRATLRQAGMDWVEDPSNRDPSQQRARLRELRLQSGSTSALLRSSQARGASRAANEAEIAAELAEKADIRPQGFAILAPAPVSAAALAALLAMVGGAQWPIAPDRLSDLAANLRPATLGGVRLTKAGRFGPGWLVLREAASVAAPVPAQQNTLWDGRFRLTGPTFETSMIGAWGDDAPRKRTDIPGLVLRALPVLRVGGGVVTDNPQNLCDFIFAPPHPAASAPFFPLPRGL